MAASGTWACSPTRAGAVAALAADDGPGADPHAAVQDRVLDPGVGGDHAVVQEDGVADLGPGLDDHARAQD